MCAEQGVWDVPVAKLDQWKGFPAAKKHLLTCQMGSLFFIFFLVKKSQNNLLSFQLVEIKNRSFHFLQVQGVVIASCIV